MCSCPACTGVGITEVEGITLAYTAPKAVGPVFNDDDDGATSKAKSMDVWSIVVVLVMVTSRRSLSLTDADVSSHKQKTEKPIYILQNVIPPSKSAIKPATIAGGVHGYDVDRWENSCRSAKIMRVAICSSMSGRFLHALNWRTTSTLTVNKHHAPHRTHRCSRTMWPSYSPTMEPKAAYKPRRLS